MSGIFFGKRYYQMKAENQRMHRSDALVFVNNASVGILECVSCLRRERNETEGGYPVIG